MTARALLPGDCDWPGVQQVFRLERHVIRLKTGESHTEVIAGLTSSAAAAATPQQILRFLRSHWRIEMALHIPNGSYRLGPASGMLRENGAVGIAWAPACGTGTA